MVQITAPGEIAFREQFKKLVYQALAGQRESPENETRQVGTQQDRFPGAKAY